LVAFSTAVLSFASSDAVGVALAVQVNSTLTDDVLDVVGE
jgi:hypothetical protein